MAGNGSVRGAGRVLTAFLGLALALVPAIVDAETPPDEPRHGLFAVEPPEVSASPASERLVQGFAARAGIRLKALASAPAESDALESSAAELDVLRNVERALLEARELSADLREAAALRVLSSAEQALLGALFVPGAHAFLAEVYTQLALCAAQLDEHGLFESALQRALSLDPSRRIEAAEAPPAILARARALARRQDLAALGESRIEAEPKDASAWLDGVRIAASDFSVRARAGLHVLVVRAGGYAPYATLLSLAPGKRPALRIALSTQSSELARRALAESRGSARAKLAPTLAHLHGAPVYLFEFAPGTSTLDARGERALVQRCDATVCGPASGLDADGQSRASFSDSQTAHAWLNARAMPSLADTPIATRQETPIWKRWPLWTGTAALLLAGVVTAVWVTRPDHHRQQRSLEIDASALPR